MSKQIEPHVLEIYQPKKLLGSGAYGHVWKVMDKKTKQILALKKIFDAFQNSTDAQRTYRQISLLHQMQHHNIVKLHRVMKSNNKRDLYLVFEHMQSDLHSLVGQSILTSSHISFILFQTLKALKYMHSAQLIHRDLKPSNILINSECQIKICDFGLARSLVHEEQQENILSQQVATRWYRSPEMLLSSRQYGKPTDVWSVGCIVAQLLIGQPIFPGNSTLNQLQKIIEFTGMPSKHSVDSLKSQVAENIINSMTVRKRPLKQYFRKCTQQSAQLIDLTLKMLEFNPNKRPTIQQLLQNKMFTEFQQHCSQQEEVCFKFIMHEVDDNTKLSVQEYRKIIYKDIQRRYPEISTDGQVRNKSVVTKSQNHKKHRSLMQKIKKKDESTYKNHSFMSKSLPKTSDQSNNSSGNKKSSLKKQLIKPSPTNPQISADYVKSKFYKTTKHQKKIQSDNLPLYQNTNQIIKPSQIFMNKNKNEENELQNIVRKQSKQKKPSKEVKQVSPPKKYVIEQEDKAQVYKNELKKMKSSKNLTKTKVMKPKFDKTSSSSKFK